MIVYYKDIKRVFAWLILSLIISFGISYFPKEFYYSIIAYSIILTFAGIILFMMEKRDKYDAKAFCVVTMIIICVTIYDHLSFNAAMPMVVVCFTVAAALILFDAVNLIKIDGDKLELFLITPAIGFYYFIFRGSNILFQFIRTGNFAGYKLNKTDHYLKEKFLPVTKEFSFKDYFKF